VDLNWRLKMAEKIRGYCPDCGRHGWLMKEGDETIACDACEGGPWSQEDLLLIIYDLRLEVCVEKKGTIHDAWELKAMR
jgi:hypothetical protein